MGTTQDTIAQAVRAAFEAWGDAWNSGDIDGYLAGYWDSPATRWVRAGNIVRGKQAITQAYKAGFPTPESLGQIEMLHFEMDVIGDQDALVFGIIAHTRGESTQKASFAAHVRDFDGDWLIVSDHVSPA